MGMETAEWYNNFCLIGHTNKRGHAWHYQQAMQGDEPNHYPEGIPYGDVVRRLFDWKPQVARTANLVPCKRGQHADTWLPRLDSEGNPVLNDEGKPVMIGMKVIEVPDKRSIVRSDNYLELGRHGTGYRIHDYEQWLLQLQSNVLGDTLDIWSAILLKNGAQACVQAALPETAHDDKTGMNFVPYIHAYTSLDGSLRTTFAAQTLLIVCDNTMTMANNNADRSGRVFKIHHSEASLREDRTEEIRGALSILHQSADESMEFFHQLAAVKVTDKKFVEVMDIILPPIDEKHDNEGGVTNSRWVARRAEKRELLHSTYNNDPMANTWKGTALGVVQAINTYATHYAEVRGGSRTQRNAEKIVRGDFARTDELTLKVLADVLGKPELVGAN